MVEYHQQSQDYPGTVIITAPLWQIIPVHQSNTYSPGIILGLPYPPTLLWQSIPGHESNTGNPGIILGLPPSQHLCGWVSQYAGLTPAVPGLSWDYHPPSTPVAEYPSTPEIHRQSRDYTWTTFSPSTPVAEYPSTPEVHRQSWGYTWTIFSPNTPVAEYPSTPG